MTECLPCHLLSLPLSAFILPISPRSDGKRGEVVDGAVVSTGAVEGCEDEEVSRMRISGRVCPHPNRKGHNTAASLAGQWLLRKRMDRGDVKGVL